MRIRRAWRVALGVAAIMVCWGGIWVLRGWALRYLQEQVHLRLGKQVSIGSLRLGRGTWILKDVRVSGPEFLYIPSLKLRYRFFPWKITGISLHRPLFRLQGGLSPGSIDSYLPAPLTFHRGKAPPWADDLSGRVYAEGDTIRIEGEGVLGGGAFVFRGGIARDSGMGRVTVRAEGVDAGALPEELRSYVSSGVLSFRAEVSLRDHLPFKAHFWTEGEDLQVPDLGHFSRIQLEGEWDGEGLWVREVRGVFEGQPFEGKGRITREGPELAFSLPRLDLGQMTEGALEGRGKGRVRLEGGWESITVKGEGEAVLALWRGTRVRQLSFSFEHKAGTLILRRVSGYIGGGEASGWGEFPARGPAQFYGRIEGVDGKTLWRLALLKGRPPEGRVWGTLEWEGPLGSPKWKFTLDRAGLVWGKRPLPPIWGVVRGGRGYADLHISGPGVAAVGQITERGLCASLRAKGNWSLGGKRFPLTGELTISRTGFQGPFKGRLHVKGPFGEIAGPFEVLPDGESLAVWLGRGSVYIGDRSLPYRGTMYIRPEGARWDIELAGGRLSGKGEGAEVIASLGRLSLRWLGLERGALSGELRASGSSCRGALTLSQVGFGGREGVNGRLRFGWEEGGPWLEGVLQDRHGLLAEVSYDGEEFLAFGQDVELSRLVRLLPFSSIRPEGMLSYQITFSGKVYRARIKGVGIKLGGIGLDYVEGDVRGEGDGRTSVCLKLSGGRVRGDAEGELRDGTLDIRARLEGDLLSFLSLLDGVGWASGSGNLELALRGPYRTPKLSDFRLYIQDGTFSLESTEVRNLVVDVRMEPDRFLALQELRAEVDGGAVEVSNRRAEKGRAFRLDLLGGMDFGVLEVRTGPSGVEAHFPGLMSPGEVGVFVLFGKTSQEPFLIEGPLSSPRLVGTVLLRNAEITYPLTGGEGSSSLWGRVDWEVTFVAGEEIWYFRDALFGAGVRLRIEEGDRLTLHGSPTKGDFWVEGRLRALSGIVTYLDREFQVEEAGMEFNTRYGMVPIVYGRARTAIEDDTGREFPIYLRLYAWDLKTGARLEHAPLNQCFLEIELPASQDISREEVLRLLGYPLPEYPRKVMEALGLRIEGRLFRSLLSPLEYRLRRTIGLDVLQIRPCLIKNFLAPSGPTLASLFYGTRWTLGEHIGTRGLLFYRGELEPPRSPYAQGPWSVQHLFGLEYRLWTDTWMKLEFSYNPLLGERDRRIGLQHRMWW